MCLFLGCKQATEPTTEFISREPITKQQLVALSRSQGLQVLELYDAQVSAAELTSLLTHWPKLKRLRIEGCVVDDAAMKAIGSLTELEILNAPDGSFSDAGLRSISQLQNLFLLRFSSPNVTGAAFAELAEMPSLRFLHLLDVPVTDDGLKSFHGMSQLESFYIDGGKETEDGIRDLLKAHPGLHFHRNQLHIADDPNADEHESPN